MFSNTEAELLLAFRSNTVRGIKKCFPAMYGGVNLTCPFGCQAEDTPEHLLACQPLLSKLSDDVRKSAEITSYQYIYGSESQQKEVICVLDVLMNVRNISASGSTLDAVPHSGGLGRTLL